MTDTGLDIVKTLRELEQGVYEDDAACDFAGQHGRVEFRMRVWDAFENYTTRGLRRYVRDLNQEIGGSGPVRVGQSHTEALRHLADGYIRARQEGAL